MDSNEFEKYLGNTISAGFVALAIALGTETGLFKVICEMERPETAKRIADVAGLKERYVVEWLGSMVAAKIVKIDGEKYFIPVEYQRHLLSKVSFAPALPALAMKHQDVVNCFKNDGPPGFSYSDSPQFFKFFHEYRLAVAGPILDCDMLPQLPELKVKLESLSGCKVCDIGCGTGVISVELAKRFPETTIIGIDSAAKAIDMARELAMTYGLTNVTFETLDVTQLPKSWDGSFDWILAYVVLHDLPDPTGSIKEMWRLLKDDGVLSIVETELHSQHSSNIGDLRASQTYTESMYVCLPSGLCTEPFGGFGAAWGVENAVDFLHRNGFVVQSINSLSNFHKGHVHLVCKKSES